MKNITLPRLHIYQLTLANREIDTITDLRTQMKIGKFQLPLTGNQFKIYSLTDRNKILYIGITKSNIRNRVRSGLKANGENGYHGYKWGDLSRVNLFVWCFNKLDKDEKKEKLKIENIEAELAFLVRKTTGLWPTFQNEIHFNNLFAKTGKSIAKKLFHQLALNLHKAF